MHLQPDAGIFGLPPLDALHVSKHVVIESMPIIEIQPCVPDLTTGMTLFKLDEDRGWSEYIKILDKTGYSVDNNGIRAAFLADMFPTDNFANDYGETFLQGATDVGSQTLSDIIQMTGSTSGTEFLKSIGSDTKKLGENVNGGAGDAISLFGSSVQSSVKSLENIIGQMRNTPGTSSYVGRAGDALNKMLAGHRVDFPQVWKNSSFSPSYTFTIRLYNPDPSSLEETKKHIIGPLAVFLSLATPRTEDGHSFTWPLLHKIKAKGIFNLQAAAITNISVIKGGDQQQISWNKRLGIVDIRIDVTSLFSSMVAEIGDITPNKDRPTLTNYLSVLEEGYDVSEHYSKARELAGFASPITAIQNQLSQPGVSTTSVIEGEDETAETRVDPSKKNITDGLQIGLGGR